MDTYRIAVIRGDGIGTEVVPEGLKVLSAVADLAGEFAFEFKHFPWGCAYYLRHGVLMPQEGIADLAGFDAIYLGAVGMPGAVPEEVAVRGLVLRIRFGFDQFANVRPVKPVPGADCVLKGKNPQDIDMVVIRENTEGMYMGLGGRFMPGSAEYEAHKGLRPQFGTSGELAVQTGIFSELGCRRVIQYAFELARKRQRLGRVTSCTKANALNHGMTLWNEVFDDVSAHYPDIAGDWQNVDAMAMRLMLEPEAYDVVVAPNLFGDIITDLTTVLQGGIGLSPGGNISRTGPSMFEPPHGSAPDIAGRGIANPLAAILTAAMMLDELGRPQWADRVRAAVGRVVEQAQALTPDLGGSAGTSAVGDAVVQGL